jgi:hypothetical protein
MLNNAPHPLNVQVCRPQDLPHGHQSALVEAGCATWSKVRVEKYTMRDLHRLLTRHWKWPMTTAEMPPDDVARVNNILFLLEEGAQQWPYVSSWAKDMAGLMQIHVNDYTSEVEALRHGDGWHRLVAFWQLRRPTADVVFLEA